jgi:hypothetical protein
MLVIIHFPSFFLYQIFYLDISLNQLILILDLSDV